MSNTLHARLLEASRKLDEQIIALAMQGMTARSIAQHTGVSVVAAKHRVSRLRKRNALPPLALCRYGDSSSKPRQVPGDLGTMAQLWCGLTRQEQDALLDMMPRGLTFAEFAASILRDVVAEEMEMQE